MANLMALVAGPASGQLGDDVAGLLAVPLLAYDWSRRARFCDACRLRACSPAIQVPVEDDRAFASR